MRDVLEEVDAWTERGEGVAIATVVGVRRSAPRPPGAKMAISESGEIAGMVSGGCVEGAVVEVAEEVLRTGEPRLLHFGIADDEAWDVGLPCGGEIDVGWRPYVVDPRARFATRERFPEAEEVVAAWPDKALEQLGGIDRATSIAVLTHDPKLDDAVLLLALRSEAPYIGAMGSRRAQE